MYVVIFQIRSQKWPIMGGVLAKFVVSLTSPRSTDLRGVKFLRPRITLIIDRSDSLWSSELLGSVQLWKGLRQSHGYLQVNQDYNRTPTSKSKTPRLMVFVLPKHHNSVEIVFHALGELQSGGRSELARGTRAALTRSWAPGNLTVRKAMICFWWFAWRIIDSLPAKNFTT